MSTGSKGLRTIAAAFALSLAANTQVATGATAVAELKIGEAYGDVDTFAEPTSPPFPLNVVTEPPLDREAGHFAYADEAGRVRAFVVTREPNALNAGGVDLRWVKKFRKNTATDRARFTVNKSWLFVAQGGAPPQRQAMYSDLQMLVALKDDSQSIPLVRTQMPNGQVLSWVRPPAEQPQFNHYAHVGTISTASSPVLLRERTRLFGDTFYEYWGRLGIEEPESWRVVQSTVQLGNGTAYYETAPYIGEIDLSDVPVGGTYDVLYLLRVFAQDDGHESVALAQLGDPLDVDSGFLLETDSTPLDDDVSLQLCDAQSDTERFVPTDDLAAMTDRYTGLTWQRCPLGYALNLNGTPNELSDDRCEAGATGSPHCSARLPTPRTASLIGDCPISRSWNRSSKRVAACPPSIRPCFRRPTGMNSGLLRRPLKTAPALKRSAFPSVNRGRSPRLSWPKRDSCGRMRTNPFSAE